MRRQFDQKTIQVEKKHYFFDRVAGKTVTETVSRRRKPNGGFTLVELIVVLVVLAILAAITIPALLGYIDHSNEKKIIMNGQSTYMAAQTLTRESYGEAEAWPTKEEVAELADVSGQVIEMWIDAEAGKVVATEEKPYRYQEDGIIVICIDGEWSVQSDGSGSGNSGGVINGNNSGSGNTGTTTPGTSTTPSTETLSTSSPSPSTPSKEESETSIETEPDSETVSTPDGNAGDNTSGTIDGGTTGGSGTGSGNTGGTTGNTGNSSGNNDKDDDDDDKDDEKDDDKDDEGIITNGQSVIIKDTSGAEHTISSADEWEDILERLEKGKAVRIQVGTVIADETGVYLCITNQGTVVLKENTFDKPADTVTCADVAEKIPEYIVKIETTAYCFSNEDVVNGRLVASRGSLYYNATLDKLYVAAADLEWIGDGRWVEINKNKVDFDG